MVILKKINIGFENQFHLMQVKSIAECSIKLPFVIKIFVLSTFVWPLKTGFTVLMSSINAECDYDQEIPLSHTADQFTEL